MKRAVKEFELGLNSRRVDKLVGHCRSCKIRAVNIGFILLLIGSMSITSCEVAEKESSKAKEKSPNIILIMCDDLGWGDTGFNGNIKIKTPNLDMLAGKGITFNRFYSASAVCSPTRGSCLTGRNPYRLGIPNANSGKLKEQEITLPELLKGRGYSTGHFGKWHLGTLTTMVKDANRGRKGDSTHYSIPSMHGYDKYFVTESKVPTFDPMLKPKVYDKAKGESLRYGWQAVEDRDSSKAYGTHYWKGEEIDETENLDGDDSKVVMDRVIPFIERSVEKGTPFFSVAWLHTPHLPVVARREMMDKYSEYSHQEQIYYASITAMDQQVGRLWKRLIELGEADNTMIWFCSDNGPEHDTPGTAGPFRGEKRSLYEGGVRVPAFCVWPNGIEAGLISDVPMVTSDYLPTIVDYLDLDFPKDRPIDGVSLKPVLSGDMVVRNSPIGFHYLHRTSWVTDEYKLISTDSGKTYELYNLLSDPTEKNNIIESNKTLATQMQKELEIWLEECDESAKGADY